MNQRSVRPRKAGHAAIASLLMTAHAAHAMPEVWQRLYNGNEIFPGEAFPFGPSDDPDGDGWTNLKESIAGTNPFSSEVGQGYLVPTIEARLYPAGQFRLQWPSQPGKEYQIQISQDLTTWTPVGGKHLGGDYPIVVDMAPELLEGGRPPLLFWRVEAGGQPVPGGGLDPWSLHVLSTRPDIRYAMMAAQGSGGTEEDPNTDGAGPTDRHDAAPQDNQINWEKVPEARYLWLPADGAGIAVDMNDKGQILHKLPNGTEGFDFTEAPVGEVWDPALPSGQRRTPVMFNPAGFQLRTWKADHAPGPDTNPHIPSGDDAPVLDAAIWPPPEGDEDRSATASVELKAIGDDGSLAADVIYSMAENFGGESESPSRFVSGKFVFLWKGGNYDRGELVGAARGFQDTISTWSRNKAIGFYEHSEEGTVTTRLMVADHPEGGTGQPTALTFHAHDPAHPSNAPLAVTTGQPARPQYLFPPDTKISRTGKVLFTRQEGAVSRGMVGGTLPYGDLPETIRDFDSITDVPPGATATWGIGSSGNFRTPAHGANANLASAAGVLQFDRTGTGIGNGNSPLRFIWRNSRWYSADEATNLPAETFSGLRPRKITPSGMIWVSNEYGTQNGVLIPITVKENVPPPQYTGTDDESIKAEPFSKGYKDRFWIMAPCGNDSSPQTNPNQNECHFHLPLAGPATLGSTATGISLDPAVKNLAAALDPNAIRWHGTGNASGETMPSFMLTGQAASGQPVGVKIMKHRKARVQVYKVSQAGREDDPGTSENEQRDPLPPDETIIPSKEQMEDYLNQLYGPQINCYFDVSIHPAVEARWDQDGDTDLNHDPEAHTPDQESVEAAVNWNNAANIHVFVIGKHTYVGTDSTSKGVTCPPRATCWITGRKYASYQTKEHFLETLGHEIGHVFFGPGHPDSSDQDIQGVAPLEGTDRSKRLMCSEINSTPESRLTVKAEWDEAEIWMTEEEKVRAMNP